MGPTLYRRRFRAAGWLILSLLLPLAPARAAGGGDPRAGTIEALALLQSLLRQETSSPSGSEIQAARVLAVFFSDKGIGCELIEPEPGKGSLLCRVRGDEKGRPVLVVAHLDAPAVAGSGRDAGSRPEAPPRGDPRAGLHAGRACGRGLLAGKGMAAVTAEALAVLARQDPLGRDILFVATADGATAGERGLKWLLEARPELAGAEAGLVGGGGLIEADGKVVAAVIQAKGPIEDTLLPRALGRALAGLAPGARLESTTGPVPADLGLLRQHGVQAYGFAPFPLAGAPAGGGGGGAERGAAGAGGDGGEECLSVENLELGVRLMVDLFRHMTGG